MTWAAGAAVRAAVQAAPGADSAVVQGAVVQVVAAPAGEAQAGDLAVARVAEAARAEIAVGTAAARVAADLIGKAAVEQWRSATVGAIRAACT